MKVRRGVTIVNSRLQELSNKAQLVVAVPLLPNRTLDEENALWKRLLPILLVVIVAVVARNAFEHLYDFRIGNRGARPRSRAQ
jgi:hypothetical protein